LPGNFLYYRTQEAGGARTILLTPPALLLPNYYMKVLVYSAENTALGAFQAVNRDLMEEVSIYSSINAFVEGLKKLPTSERKDTIVVLNLSNYEQLSKILEMEENTRRILIDVRTILVLPVEDREMTKMGHTLRPRFIAYSDESEELAAVINKMLESGRKK